jgi:hypothetical protein
LDTSPRIAVDRHQARSGTDPKAWVVLTVAACTFVAIVAVFFLR